MPYVQFLNYFTFGTINMEPENSWFVEEASLQRSNFQAFNSKVSLARDDIRNTYLYTHMFIISKALFDLFLNAEACPQPCVDFIGDPGSCFCATAIVVYKWTTRLPCMQHHATLVPGHIARSELILNTIKNLLSPKLEHKVGPSDFNTEKRKALVTLDFLPQSGQWEFE